MKIILSLILFFISVPAWATTYYVRDGGGTATQCTGTTDAVYTSGSGQPCAFNGLGWALGTGGNPGLMVANDTLIVHHLSDSGGQAKYMIGYGQNGSAASPCNSISTSYNCTLTNIPSGTGGNYTKILADNYATNVATSAMPQLWGTEGVFAVLEANASNIDIEGFEITDHSNCGRAVGTVQCNTSFGGDVGTWGRQGISETVGGVSNWILKNLYIHGMSDRGILAGGINGLTATNVQTIANSLAGWDFDISGYCGGTPCASSSGTLSFYNLTITFSGCNEEYPITHTTNNPTSITQCNDNQTANGYGDGLSSNITSGDWYFYGGNVSHNTQDGLDLLYHVTSSGSEHIYNVTTEGNTGQQIKTAVPVLTIENSKIVGNCEYLQTAGILLDPANPGNFVTCRAAGSPIVQAPDQGTKVRIINSSIWGEDGTLIEQGESGSTEHCNGTESTFVENSILFGEPRVDGGGSNSSWFYCSGQDGNGAGPCCTGGTKIVPSITYTDVWNTKDAPVSGTGNINSNPKWNQGTDMSPEPTTNNFDMSIQSSSPVRSAASSSAVFESSSNDYYSNVRPPWDMGYVIYGSCLLNGPYQCYADYDCCSAYCSNYLCTTTPPAC